MTYSYDPLRRALVVADPRLTKLMQREPETCAGVSEYASRTGIETGQVIQLLGAAVDEGVIGFEIWAEEIFVHTAPAGRPTGSCSGSVSSPSSRRSASRSRTRWCRW